MQQPPIPANEMDRLIALSDFNIDYTGLNDNFKELSKLAAKIAGMDMSHINLLDAYTQWTISYHGLYGDQTPREEGVCHYTLMVDDQFEVKDLSEDERFNHKPFVLEHPKLRYYFGVPLKYENVNLGALCVLDTKARELSPEKVEMLKIIAEEIVNRLKIYKYIETLRSNITEVNDQKKKVAHDIRGPIGGIIGLADMISQQGNDNNLDEVLEFIGLIHKSGRSVLDLADEILNNDAKEKTKLKGNELTLQVFKDRLEKLYTPQALSKNIGFQVLVNKEVETITFPQNKLMQIAGNLVSNAIKFTPKDGLVQVSLDLEVDNDKKVLKIAVKDTGEGLDAARIQALLGDNTTSTQGTGGEKGYGFGLELVKHLIKNLQGTFNIESAPGQGATFLVSLPYSGKN